jgi:hypothetical protein
MRYVAKTTVLENWVAEQISGRHWNDQPCIGQSFAEVLFDEVGFSRCGIDRDQVVVVKVDTIRIDFSQQVN